MAFPTRLLDVEVSSPWKRHLKAVLQPVVHCESPYCDVAGSFVLEVMRAWLGPDVDDSPRDAAGVGAAAGVVDAAGVVPFAERLLLLQ